ncbi:DUF4436 domain-containing protein [Mycobacterium sp. Y57]|nr:DUF4436 domain-containing protein [Mycolicibacterium xanthum]
MVDQARRVWSRGGTVLLIVAIYGVCVVGFFLLDSSAETLERPGLGASDETVVVLELVAIHPTDNQLDLNVIVQPGPDLTDDQFGVLTTDISVRLYPATDLVELNYPAGSTPAQTTTSLYAAGDPENWPFDTYTTEEVGADVIAGSGDQRRYVPARVELSGSLYGWDIVSHYVGTTVRPSDDDDITTIVLSRTRSKLALIFGICLVLVTLPALALYVAIETARGRKEFLPQYASWFAAMLFSVIPIRSALPGAPPAGSWVDEAIVFWVLLLLVAAMVIYVVTWAREGD